ncbi:MAG: IS200/IS605 family transposase [Candidatus Micrarchaeota archaeon]
MVSESVGVEAPEQVVFHLTWCTKYRYAMLRQPRFFKACEASLRSAAERHDMRVLELAVMSDHVHCVVACPRRLSASDAAHLLKGSSARDLFLFEPKFRKRYARGHFWARDFYARSVGAVDLATVRRYVREDNDPRQRQLAESN